jgi:hypothetical protein
MVDSVNSAPCVEVDQRQNTFVAMLSAVFAYFVQVVETYPEIVQLKAEKKTPGVQCGDGKLSY